MANPMKYTVNIKNGGFYVYDENGEVVVGPYANWTPAQQEADELTAQALEAQTEDEEE